jgi:hypothetical protein
MDFFVAENLDDLLTELAEADAGTGKFFVRGDQAEDISLCLR